MQNDLQWEVADLQAAEIVSLPTPPAGMSVTVVEESDSMGFPRVSVCGPDRDTVLDYIRANWGDDMATGGWYSEHVVAGIRPVGVDVTASIAKAKKEIAEDIAKGVVPASVASFSDLHDYVDANVYGGLTEEYGDASMEFAIAVQDEVHKWISSGGHAASESRAISITLHVEVPAADTRPVNEIVDALSAALRVGSDDDSVRDLEVELVIAEEVV